MRFVDKIIVKSDEIEITLPHQKAERLSSLQCHGLRPQEPESATLYCLPVILPTRRPFARKRVRLVEAIAKGRQWLDDLVSGRVNSTMMIAEREGCSDRSVRMNLSLAFLNPLIVKAAVEGRLPEGLGIARLIDQPVDWERQIEMIFVHKMR